MKKQYYKIQGTPGAKIEKGAFENVEAVVAAEATEAAEAVKSVEHAKGCPVAAYQAICCCAPVTVTPTVSTGNVRIFCLGRPTILPGNVPCNGVENGSCCFTVRQNIFVKIPIVFGADVDASTVYSRCANPTTNGSSLECSEEAANAEMTAAEDREDS